VGGAGAAGGSGGSGGDGPCEPLGVETCQSSVDEDCDGTECSIWSRLFGSAAGSEMPFAVAVTDAGDVYFTGNLEADTGSVEVGGEIVTGDAEHRTFVAKLSAAGEDLWIRELPTQGNGYARILAAPGGGVIVALGFSGVINRGGADLASDGPTQFAQAIAAFAPDGTHLWSHVLSGGIASSMVVAPSGDLVLLGGGTGAGTYAGEAVLGGPGARRFLFGLDIADGDFLWAKQYPMSSESIVAAGALAFDSDGNIIVAGTYNGELSWGGPPLPEATADAGFIARFDSDGDHLQSTRLCEGSCNIQQLAVGQNGDLFISGASEGISSIGSYALSGYHTFMARLDAADEPLWLNAYSITSQNNGLTAPEMIVDENGDVVIAHQFHGVVNIGFGSLTAEGSSDMALGKITPDGVPIWLRTFGAPGARIEPVSVTLGLQPGGATTMTLKLYQGSIDLGSGMLDELGGHADIIVARFAP
jgi:hypothetical protein